MKSTLHDLFDALFESMMTREITSMQCNTFYANGKLHKDLLDTLNNSPSPGFLRFTPQNFTFVIWPI
jgi:hypothetical protein